MFVTKDKDGNLVAVGSIDHNRLAQLQGKAKKDSAKAKEPAKAETSSVEPTPVESTPATDEPKPKPEPEPKPEPVADKPKGVAKSQPAAPKLP